MEWERWFSWQSFDSMLLEVRPRWKTSLCGRMLWPSNGWHSRFPPLIGSHSFLSPSLFIQQVSSSIDMEPLSVVVCLVQSQSRIMGAEGAPAGWWRRREKNKTREWLNESGYHEKIVSSFLKQLHLPSQHFMDEGCKNIVEFHSLVEQSELHWYQYCIFSRRV